MVRVRARVRVRVRVTVEREIEQQAVGLRGVEDDELREVAVPAG